MLFLCNLCRAASRYLHGYGVTSIKREHGVDSVLSGKCCRVLLVLLIDEKLLFILKNIQKIQYSVRLALCFYLFTSSKGTTFLRRVLKTGRSSLESSITLSSLCSRAFRVKSNESGFTRISGRELCCFSLPFTRHTGSSQRKGFRELLHMQSSACTLLLPSLASMCSAYTC